MKVIMGVRVPLRIATTTNKEGTAFVMIMIMIMVIIVILTVTVTVTIIIVIVIAIVTRKWVGWDPFSPNDQIYGGNPTKLLLLRPHQP